MFQGKRKSCVRGFSITSEEVKLLEGVDGKKLKDDEELRQRYTHIIMNLLDQAGENHYMLKVIYLNYLPDIFQDLIGEIIRRLIATVPDTTHDKVQLQGILPSGIKIVSPTSDEYRGYIIGKYEPSEV